jgi:hypothetical protein
MATPDNTTTTSSGYEELVDSAGNIYTLVNGAVNCQYLPQNLGAPYSAEIMLIHSNSIYILARGVGTWYVWGGQGNPVWTVTTDPR